MLEDWISDTHTGASQGYWQQCCLDSPTLSNERWCHWSSLWHERGGGTPRYPPERKTPSRNYTGGCIQVMLHHSADQSNQSRGQLEAQNVPCYSAASRADYNWTLFNMQSNQVVVFCEVDADCQEVSSQTTSRTASRMFLCNLLKAQIQFINKLI